jgi:4-alpha-glucanotransferase
MRFKRSSGILLHPTSLPGRYGIGDLGPHAFRWIDFLADAGCGLWQILPLGPTGYGDSPYQCFSSFAGNPYLISPEVLFDEGLLPEDALIDCPFASNERVDYARVIPWKLKILDIAYRRFCQGIRSDLEAEFESFITANSYWLVDYALFMALKDIYAARPWVEWSKPLRDREPQAIEEARKQYADVIRNQMFRQFLFFRQWCALLEYAHSKNVRVIGDIPIFVAHDSADVWSNPKLFYLDEEGNPLVVAGVPPDYFSKTGQLWGNPLYRWENHASTDYQWWVERVRMVMSLVDIIRLDHFRGFVGYWEVPASEKTAEKGRWRPGPGADFFESLQRKLGELPIIAEDLGEITPDVIELRDRFQFPGMKILQFAFEGDPSNPFLPHHYERNCVVYTGTHDNDTSRGWYDRVSKDKKDFCRRYLGQSGQGIAWDMIRSAWASVADIAIAPMQDFLNLGNEARMNYPGNPSGNWSWRMVEENLNSNLVERIREINFLFSRLSQVQDEGKMKLDEPIHPRSS